MHQTVENLIKIKNKINTNLIKLKNNNKNNSGFKNFWNK